jgi:sulfur carrier protein
VSSIQIKINGQLQPHPVGSTLAAVLAAQGIDASRRGLAAALDGQVVPRQAWSETVLRDGCRLDIVIAAPGG